MERKLQNFVDDLTSITNNALLDERNPSVVKLTNGDTEELFAICVSVLEPSYIYLPYNAIWINLDPESIYYKQPLRLIGKQGQVHLAIVGTAITDRNLINQWVFVSKYVDLFHTNIQEAKGNIGDTGDKGPIGDTGDKGPIGDTGGKGGQGQPSVIDYPTILAQAITLFKASL
jgi:hypothetical protein